MPIYEYECRACGDRHEFIQKFSDAPKRKCPGCGASRLKRLVSAAAFHLKGSGWYVTDFRDKDKKKGDEKAGKDSKDVKSPAKDAAKDAAKSTTEKATDTSTKSSDSGKSDSAKKSAD